MNENLTSLVEEELSSAARTAAHAAELLRLLGAPPGCPAFRRLEDAHRELEEAAREVRERCARGGCAEEESRAPSAYNERSPSEERTAPAVRPFVAGKRGRA